MSLITAVLEQGIEISDTLGREKFPISVRVAKLLIKKLEKLDAYERERLNRDLADPSPGGEVGREGA